MERRKIMTYFFHGSITLETLSRQTANRMHIHRGSSVSFRREMPEPATATKTGLLTRLLLMMAWTKPLTPRTIRVLGSLRNTCLNSTGSSRTTSTRTRLRTLSEAFSISIQVGAAEHVVGSLLWNLCNAHDAVTFIVGPIRWHVRSERHCV